jgi:hypothetical protein
VTTLKRLICFLARRGATEFAPRHVLPGWNQWSRARFGRPLQVGMCVRGLFAVLSLLGFAAPSAAQAQSYNMADDFGAANPSANGVWQYGWKQSPTDQNLGGLLTRYYQTACYNGTPLIAWLPSPESEPAVYVNKTQDTGFLVPIDPLNDQWDGIVPGSTVILYPGFETDGKEFMG